MIQTEWQFFTQAMPAWESMLSDCENAQQSIDFEQYIFAPDKIGHKFLDVFRRKAAQGVRIRLLCDAVGSSDFWGSALSSELSRLGVQIIFYNPISPWRLDNYSSWFLRDHRKLIVIDGQIGHMGSLGVNERMAGWRDTHMRLTGEVVPFLAGNFENMWQIAMSKKHKAFEIGKAVGFEVVTNSPRLRQRHIYDYLIDIIRGASKYIYLTTPYFVPDLRLFRALRLAAKRGVAVILLIPGKSDIKFMDVAARSYFGLALKSGVRVQTYDPTQVMHAKTAVIDDIWSTVGSCNLDNLSLKYNYELNIVSHNSNFALEVKKQFLTDITHAQEVSLTEWHKRPLASKLLESVTWPMHNFL